MRDVKVRVITDTDKANKDIKKTTKEVDNLKKSSDKSVKSSKGMASGLTKSFGALKTGILGAIPALRSFSTALISTGVGAIVVAIGGLVALFKQAADEGAEFGKEMSTLRAITGNTTEELSKLSKQAKELGGSTQFTASEVVKLQTELAKLGFVVSDIENSTPAILDLAASLEIDLASAAEFAGSIVRSFGLSTEETARVVDVMSLSTSTSALNFDALRESLKLAAPIARATNVPLEKTTALLGVLANNGLKGSIAGTGLAKIFIELNKKGLTLEEALNKVNSSSNKLGAAVELVGTIGAKSLATLANSAGDIDTLTESLGNAEGAARAMAEVRLDNLAGDTTKLSSAWSGLLLSIEDGNGILNKISRGAIQVLTASIEGLRVGFSFMSATFRNFFNFIPSAFSSAKDIVVGGFGVMLSNIKIFSSNATLALSKIPIIGEAIDVSQVTSNLKSAEKALKESQDRILKGVEDFNEASNTITRTGILKTMVEMEQSQNDNTKIKEGVNNDLITPTEDEEETDDDGVPSDIKKKEKATAGFFSMMQLDRIKSIQDANAKKKKLEDEALKEDKKRRAEDLANFKSTEDAKNAVRNAGLDAISQGFSILAGLAEESKELQAASIIAENATGIAKNIINTNAANARLTLEGGVAAPALITANNIRMGIGIASSVAAAAKGLSQLGKSGGGERGDSSEGGVQAPSFNLVEGSEGNSIQQSIEGQGNQPLKAYVVSGEITSQASLDRQIQDSSSI